MIEPGSDKPTKLVRLPDDKAPHRMYIVTARLMSDEGDGDAGGA
jgi:hypothetical protein